MTKCLVVYASKYGATRDVAQAIADGLGADLASAVDQPDVQPYDLLVVGSPIYSGTYLESITDFIEANRKTLVHRKVAAFICAAADQEVAFGLTGETGDLYTQQDYADGLAELAGGDIISCRGFGGRLIPDQLDKHDRSTLDWFYRYLMREPLKGFDLLDLPAAYRWGEELREIVGR